MVNPNVTLASEIYHKLWAKISTLELKPGERLSESGIARSACWFPTGRWRSSPSAGAL